jgi:RNA polymerase sigma-70 factor, ECF subfamily
MNLEITAFAAVSEAPRRARRTRRVLPMTDDSDEALMLAYARGNAASFDALYLRHKGGLFRYLLRHTRNRALADDLFQEVWGKLIDTRARYEVRAKFQTFLYTIAHHCFIDHCRRSAVRPTHSPSVNDDGEPDWRAPEEERPDHRAQQDEVRMRLRAALAALPNDQRDAFLLYEESGLSLDDIATVTGVGRETVKSRLRYATAKLRDAMQPMQAERST